MVIIVLALCGIVNDSLLIIWCCRLDQAIVDVMGALACPEKGFGMYSWSVGKLIMPPYLCEKSMLNKKYVSSDNKLYHNMSSSMVIDMDILPNEIRGLSSTPETENYSGGTGESEQYSFPSKRLMEQHV